MYFRTVGAKHGLWILQLLRPLLFDVVHFAYKWVFGPHRSLAVCRLPVAYKSRPAVIINDDIIHYQAQNHALLGENP